MAFKIGNLLIGLALVSLFAGLYGLVMVDLSANYAATDISSNISTYNRLDEIRADALEIEEGATNVTTSSGALDVIGGYISDAYKVVLITIDSYTILDAMSQDAAEQTNLGETGDYLKSFLLIAAILVIILTIIGYIMNSEMVG